MSQQPRHLPGGHGAELRAQQDHVRDMVARAQRIAIMCTRVSRAGRRFYRIIAMDGRRKQLYTPTGAVAAALGLRVVDGVGGHVELVLDGGQYVGGEELAAALSTLVGKELQIDQL